MKKCEIKKTFYKLVDILENCCDTTVKNKYGVITEKGMMLTENHFITYDLDSNLIRFYVDDEEVLEIDDESPIILMFKDVISLIYED